MAPDSAGSGAVVYPPQSHKEKGISMTRQEFDKMTQEGVVLLDGATGSNLMKAGLPRGVSAEQWVTEHPDVLQELQRAYVEAGSKIVYAPTFAANRISLANFGLESQVEQLNTRLVKISREAVEGRAFVAGDLTTTGQLMEPKGDMTYEKLYHAYQEQVRALADAGADLLVAETMLSVEETIVALDAAQSVCQLPVMCTLSLEADGTAMYGSGCFPAGNGGGCRGPELFRGTGSAGIRGSEHERGRHGSGDRQTERRNALH